ncbi:hypothetical protein KM043_002468 [Ampulex compressa]|nr:hypothetical protein KM043_002468 [Ampulex compressa]
MPMLPLRSLTRGFVRRFQRRTSEPRLFRFDTRTRVPSVYTEKAYQANLSIGTFKNIVHIHTETSSNFSETYQRPLSSLFQRSRFKSHTLKSIFSQTCDDKKLIDPDPTIGPADNSKRRDYRFTKFLEGHETRMHSRNWLATLLASTFTGLTRGA